MRQNSLQVLKNKAFCVSTLRQISILCNVEKSTKKEEASCLF